MSQRRACRVLVQPRSSHRFEGKPKDERLTKRILHVVRERPRWGYRRICQLLRRDGETLNRKNMYRHWRASGPQVPQKRRIKRASGVRGNACNVQAAGFCASRAGRSIGLVDVVYKSKALSPNDLQLDNTPIPPVRSAMGVREKRSAIARSIASRRRSVHQDHYLMIAKQRYTDQGQ